MWALCSVPYTFVFMPVTVSVTVPLFSSQKVKIPPALLFFKVNLTAHGTLEILGSFFLFLQKMKLGC